MPKKAFLIILSAGCIFLTQMLTAQNVPEMPFMFWLRNQNGIPLTNKNITVRVSLVSKENDQSFFSENQQLQTNGEGMISLLPGPGYSEAQLIAFSLTDSIFFKADADSSGKEIFDYKLLLIPIPKKNALVKKQNEVRISASGDTLFLESGAYRIFSGLSQAKPREKGGKMGTDCHTCGAKEIHNPELEYGTVTDYDGNVYKTIAIGSQVWMAENLKSAHFQNGDMIPHLKKKLDWMNADTPGFCWYRKDSAKYVCPYGKLYNWYAATDPRNVCPFSWHVPLPSDWNLLQDLLGGKAAADEKLKVVGKRYFRSFNNNSNNISGFSAIPTGFRHINGSTYGVRNIGHFWTSVSFDYESANAS